MVNRVAHNQPDVRCNHVSDVTGPRFLQSTLNEASRQEQINVQREIDIQTKLSHANIVRMVTWFQDPKWFYLVLDYASGGDVYKVGGRSAVEMKKIVRISRPLAIIYSRHRLLCHTILSYSNQGSHASCPTRALTQALRRNGSGLPHDIATRYLRDAVSAVAYLHENHVIHRDIKARRQYV